MLAENDDQYDLDAIKRSLSSLARAGQLPASYANNKRSISAMARLGMLRQPNGLDEMMYDVAAAPKRSIATLAKNGQLPSKEPETESDNSEASSFWQNEKRNIGALARSGLIGGGGKRYIGSVAQQRNGGTGWSGKRNLASIVRASARPGGGGAGLYGGSKRNIASLARSSSILPMYGEFYKRNVGALARDWSLPTTRVNAKREATEDECKCFTCLY